MADDVLADFSWLRIVLMLVQPVLTAQYRPRCTVQSLNSSRVASVGAHYGHGLIYLTVL